MVEWLQVDVLPNQANDLSTYSKISIRTSPGLD